ncbi:hypothetical protein BYT27DRAFT_7185576 [Phlegmacium glaucopus]|nr:hypothetical protein BYT27DRAFT_7185576 [Phlegmacium glaucopus]
MEATSSEARLTFQKNSVNTQGNRLHSFELVSGNTFLPDQQQQFVEIITNFKLYHSDFI